MKSSLIGANGAGKSSILRAISGSCLRRHDRVRGPRSARSPAHRIVGLGMAHVPEGRGIFGYFSSGEPAPRDVAAA